MTPNIIWRKVKYIVMDVRVIECGGIKCCLYWYLSNIIVIGETQEFVPLKGNSNLVQTGWALMGLIHSGQVISKSKQDYLLYFK